MALITTGSGFIRDLEKFGSLGVFVPLEGGYEGRYRRRLRAAGYVNLHITARGLGDVAAYLMGIHGIRPPHLGKKSTSNGAAVGEVQYLPPLISSHLAQLPPNSKGLLLWVIEGNILSDQEVEYFTNLPRLEPRVKVVIERGGDRYFRWTPLEKTLLAS
ncbi:NAD(P)H-quinone oxidoreductase [Cylindrospermopsis raciborskii CENA303]|uniref:NAD(P)H-quinone oxidoreductase subunit N n=1 Tax=Cylindrospermopsis raciborskii CENA303 TaxID=1170769 RepID=A0A1X4GB03_9CYAN|nr:NAD(P)H-quinone oxidoreductase subunit N [Cylindrospermopsis raciborskii]OSO94361.1 NAD(P)H-quinone oxidoreductase [Cylindrospermopsis raciborskii CENA303]